MNEAHETNQRYLKEERAENFRTNNLSALLQTVPVLPDPELAALRGEMIGEGSTRRTFMVLDHEQLVIKEAKPRAVGANWTEYIVWSAGRVTRWAPVLGTIHSISESGQYLVMERLSNLSEEDRFRAPDIPYWLNDLKTENFGKTVDGSNAIKARDYAIVNLAFELEETIPYTPGWKQVRPRR